MGLETNALVDPGSGSPVLAFYNLRLEDIELFTAGDWDNGGNTLTLAGQANLKL